MAQKIKRGWVDWAVIGVMVLIPASLAALALFTAVGIAYPNPETKTECIRRVTKEISVELCSAVGIAITILES